MGSITVLSDESRGIAFDDIMEQLENWMEGEDSHESSDSGWNTTRYCIIDYQESGQAVSASNAIRAFMPDIPLLIVTDFQSMIRKRHLQQITGAGPMKMFLWDVHHPQQMVSEMQKWLESVNRQNLSQEHGNARAK